MNDNSDGNWQALVKGQLSRESEAALRQRAAQDQDAARAYALFRPLDDTAVARLSEELVERARRARRSRRMAWQAGSGFFVSASLVAVLLAWPHGGEITIPPYEIELSPGEQAERGSATPVELPAYSPESTITVTLLPKEAVEVQPKVAAYTVEANGTLHPWKINFQPVGSALRADALARTLPQEGSGAVEPRARRRTVELLFLIAPPKGMPEIRKLEELLPGTAHSRPWQVLRKQILFGEPVEASSPKLQ